jgi:acyl carrier protein phosphodiesterase
MNYLAHLFLSGDNDEIMVGNMMEDFIVGRIDHPRNNHIPENMKMGIQLHRLIDSFTDTNLILNNCKSVLYPKYHKYSAVILDVFFDHYLAIHWHTFSTENLANFSHRAYRNFEKNYEILPEKMKPMIDSMIQHDWLKNYAEFWGIERALLNISRRTTFENQMSEAVKDLKENYQIFDENFKLFFPLLLSECQTFLNNHGFTFSQSKN